MIFQFPWLSVSKLHQKPKAFGVGAIGDGDIEYQVPLCPYRSHIGVRIRD